MDFNCQECKSFTMDLKPLLVPATLEQERDSRLRTFGFLLEEVKGDGNCLLRAISQQLWRSQEYYELLRRIVVAQLNCHRDLYKHVVPSDLEYRQALRDCSTPNCAVPIVAAHAIADVLEVEFAVLCSYSPLNPFSLVQPQDPRTKIRKVLYLCTSLERLEDNVGHCDSMVPMHRTVHEPVSIPDKALRWMKHHNLLMLEDLNLFPPRARSFIPDLSKGTSAKGKKRPRSTSPRSRRSRYSGSGQSRSPNGTPNPVKKGSGFSNFSSYVRRSYTPSPHRSSDRFGRNNVLFGKGVPAESGPSKLVGSSVSNRQFAFKNLLEAQQLNKDIFETIYYHALKTSSQIAEKEGPYETYIGSPVSKVRISSKPEGQGARGLAWHHATCFLDASPTTQLENLDGWESLTDSNKSAVLSMVKTVSANKKGKDEVKEEKESLKGSAKRKGAVDRDQKLRMAKTEDDNKNNELDPSKLQSLLEPQTKELWALKDDLKNHVSTAELREMLEANNQSTSGSEIDLRDRCADGMLFGTLESCKFCNGHLHYSGGTYKCRGFLTEWSKCANSTSEPDRVKGKWKIPEETKNQYLKKWFKTQKANKPSRIIPLPSPSTPAKPAGNGTSQSSYSEKLADLKVSIISFSSETMDVWKAKIESVGGQFHPKVKKDTNCLVVCGVPDNMHAEMRKARRMKVPIVREDYLADCFERQKKLRLYMYKIEAANKSMVTVKVKGRSVVHEASGLQDTGHILEHGKSIYNTTLSLSDLSTGINSYYILQIIEEDKGSDCYVFRKWGRVSNEKIGGTKLQEFSKTEAIKEFKRLFLEKTGNSWESWEQKKLQKQSGKFYPLDIDYGANKDAQKTNKIKNAKSQLAPPLAELMKMVFNVETYRAAMEFEINMAEMPLGKFSKSNIQKGFEVLTELQNLLKGMNDNPALRESMIVDASNRFFTVIPSVHPHVIKDEDDFKLKVKMLEALQDIEIASRLVGFDADNDDSIDDKYKKFQCEMGPLPHDSEDYQLVEKYLQTTHATTHTDWALELEVFTVDRQGAFDKFSPYKDKLKNKMLLWHGSRLTNLVGILSQGLRIAPPEAPATRYMFGKGIYFADLVSKSAQYCFTDKKNPAGLMLLSEVALGDMYELKNAKYMDKPPKGKDSTKGLGQKIPVKWRDDVVVPCGKPVSSNVKATGLMYNEYIVYNSDQVKLQFLLKVRFHHKR